MANFTEALNLTLKHEGGYVLHKVEGDRGGLTYAGISERAHPTWEGWRLLNAGNEPGAKALVRDFYRKHYWDKVRGDSINSQRVANTIFDTAVNMGVGTATKMAQLVIGLTADGVLGNVSIAELNKFTLGERGERLFLSEFALAKVTRVALIVRRSREQGKFLLGWIVR